MEEAERRTAAQNQRYLIHERTRKVTLVSQDPASAFAALQPTTSFKTPSTAIIPNPSGYQGSTTQPSKPEVSLVAIFEAGIVSPKEPMNFFSRQTLNAATLREVREQPHPSAPSAPSLPSPSPTSPPFQPPHPPSSLTSSFPQPFSGDPSSTNLPFGQPGSNPSLNSQYLPTYNEAVNMN